MNKPYTQADMDAVSDTPELTDEQLATARPFEQVFPAFAKDIRTRGPQKKPKKVQKTLRLSPDVLEFFEATGAGWQTRIDDVLKQWVAEHR